MLALAILLQRLDIRFDNPAYNLSLQVNLTMKPKNMYLRAKIRHDLTATQLEHQLSGLSDFTAKVKADASETANGESKDGKLIRILFGSNTGTCEELAQRLGADVAKMGYHPRIDSLDSAALGLPRYQPTVLITSSYEGQPPDNARRFVDAIIS